MSHIQFKKVVEIWNSLKAMYEKANVQQEMLTASKIWDYKYSGGSMAEYCNKFKMLISENACAGGVFPPFQQAALLIRGLPSHMKGASDKLKQVDKANWTLQIAITIVLEEEITARTLSKEKQAEAFSADFDKKLQFNQQRNQFN